MDGDKSNCWKSELEFRREDLCKITDLGMYMKVKAELKNSKGSEYKMRGKCY